ncbi:DUF4224 domain-containing protein [Xylophilus sp.]|uniref:DUF4224 domain-containing protein n=1 Tax=Xylophilus sp. TaxID=2653893 RepID=UPI0013B9E51B|nr:DUF4224 domain-containing protein [Xylophilus sp.]KAF1045660.1 MAG: hypothetical protein GAK38_02952 [Xylophilus sp.]
MGAAEPHPFLSLEEVKELTGAGTKRKILANLRKNGIRHSIRADGWPSVAWANVVGTALDQLTAGPAKKWTSNKAA